MSQLFKNKFLQGLTVAIILLVSSFNTANAEEYEYAFFNTLSTMGTNIIYSGINYCQSFPSPPDNQPITAIGLKKRAQLNPHTGDLFFSISSDACIHYGGGTVDYSVTLPASNFDYTIGEWIYWDLSSETVTYASGTKLYLNMSSNAPASSGGYKIVYKADNGDDYWEYRNDSYYPGRHWDVKTSYYADNDLTSYYNTYDYDLAIDYPDFNTVVSQVCMIGEDCNLWFSFNDLAVGYPMYLLYSASSTVPTNAISSMTVTATSYFQHKISVPAIGIESEVKYDLLLDADEYGWTVKSAIIIKWIEPDYWENLITDRYGEAVEEYCAEVTVCADVATTSDFFYGVTCGARRTICWVFAPSANSKKYIANAVTGFEESFPFNLYFTFVNRISNIVSNQATSTTESIGIPFIDSEGEYYMLPVITTSTVPNALGTSYGTVHTGTVNFIWIITSLIVTLIVYKAIW